MKEKQIFKIVCILVIAIILYYAIPTFSASESHFCEGCVMFYIICPCTAKPTNGHIAALSNHVALQLIIIILAFVIPDLYIKIISPVRLKVKMNC